MGRLIIDSHLHLYRSAQDGLAAKEGYEIWEYGHRDVSPPFAEHSGDVESARAALDEAGCSFGIVTNLHDVQHKGASVKDDLIASNQWAVDLATTDSRFVPLVAVDPNVMSIDENVEHLQRMAAEGARGIKVHPPIQAWDMRDEDTWRIFDLCVERDLVVVAHSGPSSDGSGRGTPNSFRPLLKARPELKLVLAHMGGKAWREVSELAHDHPQVYFDLCEIVEWLGAEHAPTPKDFVKLVRDVGADRVLFGSDFPWYDIAHTVKTVENLPEITGDEVDRIGLNAAQLFGLADGAGT